MAKDPYKKFPIGTLVKVKFPSMVHQKSVEQLGIVVPIDKETTDGWKYFIAVYLSEPGPLGPGVRNVRPSDLTSVSRAYKKEKI